MSRITPITRLNAGRHAEGMFKDLAEQSGDVLASGESNGRLRYVSPAVTPVLGYRSEQLLNRRIWRFLHPADVERLAATLERAKAGGLREVVQEVRVRHREGYWLWMESRLRWLPGVGPDAAWRWVGSQRDITERRRFEQRLAAEKERAQATLKAIADGVVSVGADGRVDYLNPAAERILGWSSSEAIGEVVTKVFVPAGHRPPPAVSEGVAGMSAWLHSVSEAPVTLRKRDGKEAVVQMTVAVVADNEGRPQGLVLTFRDTSQTAALLRELAYRTSHDSLTGLLNREEFERQLKRLAHDASAGGGPHALCYIDLDQFKLVNDTCGHAAGDALLKDVAKALEGQIGKRDVLARLGGDEFGLILPDCPSSEALRRAQAVVDALEKLRFAWSDRQFSCAGSVGVAPIDRNSGTHESVLMAADAACYVAKDRGRGRVHAFEPEDVDLSRRDGEMRWIPRLQTALEVGDFQLLAQDIVALGEDGPVKRYIEVLIVLPGASGRLVGPSEFLPAAQRYGLMSRIDRWVVTQVSEWLHWRANTQRALPEMVAINLSGSSISDADFRDFVEEQVRGLPPGARICFEIIENEAIASIAEAGDFMRRIKRFNCFFALDDFGSGLASFDYLKRLPVDFVKIDGQFVRESASDAVNLAMVESIHRIGKVMGIKTIAEFVETEAVYRRMKDIGVDFAQGFYFGVPRPLLSLE